MWKSPTHADNKSIQRVSFRYVTQNCRKFDLSFDGSEIYELGY